VTVFPRRRILNEKDLKTYQTIVSKWLHQFLADENASVYLPKGIKFNSPEKNNWKWFEMCVVRFLFLAAIPPPSPLLTNFVTLSSHVLNDSQKDHHTSNPVGPSPNAISMRKRCFLTFVCPAPSNPRPPKPQFGNDLHITVSDPLEVSDHTEYMITVRFLSQIFPKFCGWY
jgi:hypothetical protein